MELLIGLMLLLVAVTAATLALLAPSRAVPMARRRPARLGESSAPGREAERPGGFALYERAALERAGIRLGRGAFTRRVLGGAAGAGLVGLLAGGPPLGAMLLLLVPVGGRLWLAHLAGKRRAAFEAQLPDTLQLLSGSLRAGHSILRAIDAAANEAQSPTSDEMRRIVSETSLGRDLLESLSETAERMRNEDFSWVAQAIQINREVGGNLAEVLDQVNDTIRERGEIKGHIRALAAEGKFSAYILMAMPVAIVAILAVVNPGYMSLLFTEPLGWAMIAASVVLMTVGGLWLRKIIDLKF